MGFTEEDYKVWLKPILLKEDVDNYSIVIEGNSEVGDGYLGDITFITVDGESKQGNKKQFNLVLKIGKRSEDLRKVMPIRSAFENEIFFYKEIVPVYERFQQEKSIKEPFNNYPKCYGTILTEDIEILVLDNMKNRNYSVHNRMEPMDKEHVLKVMKTYGKLHAISYALRSQKPDVFQRLSSQLMDIFKIIALNSKQNGDTNTSLDDLIAVADESKDSRVIEKAMKMKAMLGEMHEVTDPDDPYAVILHGDCWNNNFMFKFKDNTSDLDEVSLIDFQITRLASPIYDLSYFLFTCMAPEDVQDFDGIINEYYSSYSDFLSQLGEDPHKSFPYEEFLKQWRKFSIFGLIMMPGLIKVCVSDKEEVLDLTEVAESGQTMSDAFSYRVKNFEEYRRRILPILKLAVDKEFIEDL